MPKPAPPCPCGSGRSLADCCGPYLEGQSIAPTAEALMRSRYTAYVLLREDYLLSTWHASTRPPAVDHSKGTQPKWIGLEVKQHLQLDETHAIVEFVARYKLSGRAHRLHEKSRFVREADRWFYLDGDIG